MKEVPAKQSPTEDNLIFENTNSDSDSVKSSLVDSEKMFGEDVDEDIENKINDLDHEDNVNAANKYLEGLVGQVFQVPIAKKNENINWLVIDDSDACSDSHKITVSNKKIV